jgi:ribosome-associated heat shock protein Hsp15
VTATQRLDKWVWYARLARTRSGAQRLIAAGRVRLNSARVRSNATPLKPGDVLTVTLPRAVRVLKVRDTGVRRGAASAAAALYEDLSPQLEPGHSPASSFERAIRAPAPGGRPSKRDRRLIERMKAASRNGISPARR